MTDLKNIRRQSQNQAKAIGCVTNDHLPLLEWPLSPRVLNDIADRLFCVLSIVACSYGFPKPKAWSWLVREHLEPSLTPNEMAYLKAAPDQQPDTALQWRVEALWALAWCVGVHDTLDFTKTCSDSFVTMLPDLAQDESTERLRSRMARRDMTEILQSADLAYCLHWSVRDAQIKKRPVPSNLQAQILQQRRHTLDWVLGEEEWDKVSLDT
ncbi:MAG: DUF4272 domain-containing protein [Planctomycetota bacterium]